MDKENEFEFRKLGFNDLQVLVKWAEEEGWNPGPHDAEVYWQTDPDGFYGYFHDGSLVAGGSIVAYDKAFGFMGFFIVEPGYRSHGIGRKLWYQRRNMLLSRLEKDATIGMDGVVAMQPFYEKGGFAIAFRDERYEKTGMSFPPDPNISAVSDDDFEAIMTYDKTCFGFSRPQFLKPWLALPGNKTFKYSQGKRLKGFAVVRKACKGYKIGPLFADDEAVAAGLYKACLNSVVGEPVYLDIPVINQGAVNLIRKFDAKYVFECARMYFGKSPCNDIKKVFGITTFELG